LRFLVIKVERVGFEIESCPPLLHYRGEYCWTECTLVLEIAVNGEGLV